MTQLPQGGWTAGGRLGKLLCALGSHPCRPVCDDTGCWGECDRCHRRFGFVDRASLRRYADAEYARAALAKASAGTQGER